jgi:hypothetical protein
VLTSVMLKVVLVTHIGLEKVQLPEKAIQTRLENTEKMALALQIISRIDFVTTKLW